MSATSQNFEVEVDVRPVAELIADLERPWQNERVLRELYWGREMSTRQIADELGCSDTTVGRWLQKHDISTRDHIEATRNACRVERASFGTHEQEGYEQWTASGSDGKTRTVGVHQLLAIADGADPHDVFDGHDVHHVNWIPWDNRAENLEVMTHAEHSRHHHAEE